MNISSNYPKVITELQNVINLFLTQNQQQDIIVNHNYNIFNDSIQTEITFSINKKNTTQKRCDRFVPKTFDSESKYIFKFAKLVLYEILFTFTKSKKPWGAITGIRPTKVFNELLADNNNDFCKAKDAFIKNYHVTVSRADITEQIIKNQINFGYKKNLYHLYINIPICTSRCYYCSFLSNTLNNCQHIVDDYVAALIKEIKAITTIAKQNKISFASVYIGGGTPTALNEIQLEQMLKAVPKNILEITVECGRPDTITKEKLTLLKKYNVTRICVNPQTFNDNTLAKIGRTHSSSDTIDVYNLAKSFGFIINMDLIAGLNSENAKTFRASLNTAISLQPNNITVHTLSVKRTSVIKEKNLTTTKDSIVQKMVEYSIKKLSKNLYKPYYLYKQKYMLSHLENIGYFKNADICIFNIASMEDESTIFAAGANAISKRYYFNENRIERLANVKNLQDYINNIDEIIMKKEKFFKL